MTKDEFIEWDIDDGVLRLTGNLDGQFGFESEKIILVKLSGDTDAAVSTWERFSEFNESLAHAYADGEIMRFHQIIGDIGMLEKASGR